MQLKELRKKNNLTQQELAEKLSISKSFVSQLERGERQMSLHLLRKYAGAVSVKPENVLQALEATQRDLPIEKDLAERVSRIVKQAMRKKHTVSKKALYGNSNSNR